MEYIDYKAEDFLEKESFLNWYYKQNPQDQHFWENWLLQHPEKQADVQKAIQVLQWVSQTQQPLSVSQLAEAKQALFAAIDQWEQSKTPVIPLYRNRWAWLSVAASVVLLVVFSWWFLQPVTYHTAYGETQTIALPDGSKVMLNANSEVRYKRWSGGEDREIWLKGEAYFKVTHTRNHARFTVHTQDVNVEVLGTSFNVCTRAKQTRVILDEGKVKLSQQDKLTTLVMRPGDLVEVKGDMLKATPKQVNTAVYTAWKEGQLIFDRTPLEEIVQLLENNYGYEVQVQDPELLNLPFTYTLVGNDVDLLIHTIAESLELDISKNNQTLRIRKKTAILN
jgi:ferric-dicitrate binding protein FerR (iron transport regulator)